MEVSTDRAALPIRPHRAYRRPRPSDARTRLISALLLVGIEVLVLLFLEDLAGASSRIARALVPGGGTLASDRFLGIHLRPIDLSVKPLDYRALAVWSVAGVLGIALLVKARRLGAPIRFIGAYNLVLATASAIYILYNGRLGYDPLTFSELYLRTVVLIWIILPLLVGALSLVYPFSAWERLGLVATTLVYDVVLSTVRYAVVAWALSALGAVVMANLYLFLGPLLDFVYLVGVFSMFLVPLSHRLDREGPQDLWAWL